MALQYPGYTNIQASPSSLAAFMPAFQAGQTRRADENAFAALANVYGGQGAPAQQQPQSALEMLAGFGSQPYAPATGPIPTTQPSATPVAPPAPPSPAPQYEYTSAGRPVDPDNGFLMAEDDPRYVEAMTLAPGAQSQTVAAIPTSTAPMNYLSNVRAAESGGNDSAANPRSTALGRYQFLESTWNGLMQQYPELGLTANGRTDPGQQERAMARFTEDNARTLAGAGIPVNPGNLYAAHFLGAGGATNVLGQDPASPLSAYLEPGVLEANPHLQGMTVGDFAAWAQNKGGNSSGGYAPPTVDVGAVQGARAYVPDAATLETLLRSEATRPVALSLIGAQQEANASQGRFVTEQGSDGAIFQRDTLTGELQVLISPQQAGGATDETFFGNPVPFQDANGNIQFGQIGNRGTFRPINLGEGGEFVSPTKTVNTETEQIVMDQFGNVLSRIPIQNRDAAFETAVGTNLGEAQAEGVIGAPQALANADALLSQIDGVLNDPALGQAIGFGGILPAIPNSDQAGVITRIEQLQGQAFLQAFESLKGGGQITEVEGQKATAAIARLSRIQNREDFESALGELRAIVVAARDRAAQRGGVTTQQSPPASSAAAPSSAPITIADDAGYNALPSGARFIGPDGLERVKP